MSVSDTTAFAEQLNIILQTCVTDEMLEQACALLCMHTAANVLLMDETGTVLTHRLMPGEVSSTPPAADAVQLTLPVYEQDLRIGVLTMYRRKDAFNDYERLMASIILSVCTVLLRQGKEQAEVKRRQQADAVKSVLNTLSFSELEAVVQVFRALQGSEGLLVTGRIADKLRITRSVVVNGLRKLEGTGMIETRSLGMKGTYLRMLNPLLGEELKKFWH